MSGAYEQQRFTALADIVDAVLFAMRRVAYELPLLHA
jgi:hypothetical protein